MKVSTQLVAAIASLFVISVTAFADESKELRKEDAQAVNQACASDASTAGCGQDLVGKGLLKCIHAYKKAHKDFKVSQGCHQAMKKRHDDHKESN